MYYYYLNEAGQFSITHTLNEKSFLAKCERLCYETVVSSTVRLTPDICLLEGRRIDMGDSREINMWLDCQSCWSVYNLLGSNQLILDFKKCQEKYFDDISTKIKALKPMLANPAERLLIATKLGVEDSEITTMIVEELDAIDLSEIWTTDRFIELESITYPVLDIYG